MRRIVLLLLLVFSLSCLPRVLAARNNGAAHTGSAAAGVFQTSIGFNGGDFADGGRSPFGR
jgi:hypothetical protein